MSMRDIAELMFTQMNDALKESGECSRIMSTPMAKEVKECFQRDYERNHREDDDPLECPWYEYTTETLFPGVVRLTVKLTPTVLHSEVFTDVSS